MDTNHVKMLCDIGELNGLFHGQDHESLLQKIVDMVSEHMKAQVCSVYLLDEQARELVLKATRGLNSEAVDSVRLKPGEGLVGSSLEDMTIVCEGIGRDNPKFKPLPGIGEENYQAFLAVPIIIGIKKIGVIAVQRRGENCFDEEDALALKATASQLASMLQNIKLMMALSVDEDRSISDGTEINETVPEKFIKGKSASKGHSYAPVKFIKKSGGISMLFEVSGNESLSIGDFEKAVDKTREQLEDLQKRVEEKLSDAASLIFSSHLMMLNDRGLMDGIREKIHGDMDVVAAVLAQYNKYRDIFSKSANHIIREKVQDIEDLTVRIIDNLLERDNSAINYHGHIIIADELYPSDLLKLSADEVAGVVLVGGGVTSHVSILARSLGIPMVFSDRRELLKLGQETKILLDADQGNIYISPDDGIIRTFNENEAVRLKLEREYRFPVGPAITKDGTSVTVMVNINLLSDLKNISPADVDGIGLYRTEFPFMIRSNFPTEEEQIVIYEKLLQGMPGKPVTFRTLDIGGDKVLSYYESKKEENPFLGMRSIRFSLKHEDIFRQQIRAILRAGADKNIRIMFPMISSMDEFIKARELVESSIDELSSGDYTFNRNPKIGIMIEIPSVISIIDDLAASADFMSIGTNDFIQYVLAVDRTNENVAHLYNPLHPAVIRSLKTIIEAGTKSGTDVSICGDMASDVKYIPLLLGLGMRSLSVDSIYIPRTKRIIADTKLKDVDALAGRMIASSRIDEIEVILDEYFNSF